MKLRKTLALILAVLTIGAAVSSCASGDVSTQTTTPADTNAEVTTAVETTAEQTTEAAETKSEEELAAEYAFRYDNFANGKLSDNLLNTVNDGVLALLSECMYYESELQKGLKRGELWVYSNKSQYVPQSGTFDDMVKSGKVGGNCSMPQAWFFVEMGIISNGKHIYGNSTGELANWGSYGKYIGAISTVYKWGGKKFSEMYMTGNVMPGDIFYAKGHTFIYLGDEKFMAAGHDGKWHTNSNAQTEDSRKAVFETWVCDMKSNADWSYSVTYQIRLNDNYCPRFYRNAAGELVANPMYKESLNVEYKEGVSPETPRIINKSNVDYYKVYDTSGKTNVLKGITPKMSEGFNLGKLEPAANITDGQLYYDNTENTYTDIKISNMSAWFDANGNQSATKDETHKYLCGIKFTLAESQTMNSFSIYTQAVGASSGKSIGDIDGFDILVSEDGTNWTVAYSVENAACEYKWTDSGDAKNKSTQGAYMCHYIRADFAQEVTGKYVMFALTQPRTQTAPAADGVQYDILTSTNFFRISELQVYKK